MSNGPCRAARGQGLRPVGMTVAQPAKRHGLDRPGLPGVGRAGPGVGRAVPCHLYLDISLLIVIVILFNDIVIVEVHLHRVKGPV